MKITISKNMKRFNHLTGEIAAVYHTAALKLGLSDSVMQVLYTIFDSGEGCPLTYICRLTGLTKQTVNSAVRGLEREGLVRMEAVDARSKKVLLTAQGVSFAENTVAKLIRAENEIFDAWSDEEINGYLLLTERYLNALREKTEAL